MVPLEANCMNGVQILTYTKVRKVTFLVVPFFPYQISKEDFNSFPFVTTVFTELGSGPAPSRWRLRRTGRQTSLSRGELTFL